MLIIELTNTFRANFQVSNEEMRVKTLGMWQ